MLKEALRWFLPRSTQADARVRDVKGDEALRSSGDQRERMVSEMADGIDQLAFKVCDVGGEIDIVNEQLATHAEEFERMRRESSELAEANRRIDIACRSASHTANEAAADIAKSLPEARAAVENLRAVIADAQDFGERSSSLNDTLEQVATVSNSISEVAYQINVLSLNASIEAAQAGAGSEGFAVVADEVKKLAAQASEATSRIDNAVSQLRVEFSELGQQGADNAQRAGAAREDAERLLDAFMRLDSNVVSVHEEMKSIEVSADANLQTGASVAAQIEQLLSSVSDSSVGLGRAAERTSVLMAESEVLIAKIAQTEITFADTPIIKSTVAAAQKICQLFEQALERGEIDEQALFDENYVEVPGTDPTQFMTSFVELTDRLLPPILQSQLAVDSRVLFCAAVDRNGYLPTHNEHLSHSQGPDPEWNDVHCRQRRFFNATVPAAAASNTRPIFVQTHRRVMEDGSFALIKDLSVPIFVRARHWGGLRCGFTLVGQ